MVVSKTSWHRILPDFPVETVEEAPALHVRQKSMLSKARVSPDMKLLLYCHYSQISSSCHEEEQPRVKSCLQISGIGITAEVVVPNNRLSVPIVIYRAYQPISGYFIVNADSPSWRSISNFSSLTTCAWRGPLSRALSSFAIDSSSPWASPSTWRPLLVEETFVSRKVVSWGKIRTAAQSSETKIVPFHCLYS